MKKLLIIYNIIFLFTGNVLLSSAHHLLFHDHEEHIQFEKHECIECINAENSNNYILDFLNFNQINDCFFRLETDTIFLKCLRYIELIDIKIFICI